MQDRLAHLGPDSPTTYVRRQPRERNHGPVGIEVVPDQLLHSHRLSIEHDGEAQSPGFRGYGSATTPHPLQPLVHADGWVLLVQRHGVVKWSGVRSRFPIPHQGL